MLRTYLGVSLHVLQELSEQRDREGDVRHPEVVQANQRVGRVLTQTALLSTVNVPADKNINCVLEKKKMNQPFYLGTVRCSLAIQASQELYHITTQRGEKQENSCKSKNNRTAPCS